MRSPVLSFLYITDLSLVHVIRKMTNRKEDLLNFIIIVLCPHLFDLRQSSRPRSFHSVSRQLLVEELFWLDEETRSNMSEKVLIYRMLWLKGSTLAGWRVVPGEAPTASTTFTSLRGSRKGACVCVRYCFSCKPHFSRSA